MTICIACMPFSECSGCQQQCCQTCYGSRSSECQRRKECVAQKARMQKLSFAQGRNPTFPKYVLSTMQLKRCEDNRKVVILRKIENNRIKAIRRKDERNEQIQRGSQGTAGGTLSKHQTRISTLDHAECHETDWHEEDYDNFESCEPPTAAEETIEYDPQNNDNVRGQQLGARGRKKELSRITRQANAVRRTNKKES